MNARPPAVWLERARSGLCHRCCRERRCSFSSCCDNGRCLPNTHCVVPSCRWPAVRHVSIVRAACFRFAHVWERSPAVEGGRVLQLDWQGRKKNNKKLSTPPFGLFWNAPLIYFVWLRHCASSSSLLLPEFKAYLLPACFVRREVIFYFPPGCHMQFYCVNSEVFWKNALTLRTWMCCTTHVFCERELSGVHLWIA